MKWFLSNSSSREGGWSKSSHPDSERNKDMSSPRIFTNLCGFIVFSTPPKINGWNRKITQLKRKSMKSSSNLHDWYSVFHLNFPGRFFIVQHEKPRRKHTTGSTGLFIAEESILMDLNSGLHLEEKWQVSTIFFRGLVVESWIPSVSKMLISSLKTMEIYDLHTDLEMWYHETSYHSLFIVSCLFQAQQPHLSHSLPNSNPSIMTTDINGQQELRILQRWQRLQPWNSPWNPDWFITGSFRSAYINHYSP